MAINKDYYMQLLGSCLCGTVHLKHLAYQAQTIVQNEEINTLVITRLGAYITGHHQLWDANCSTYAGVLQPMSWQVNYYSIPLVPPED